MHRDKTQSLPPIKPVQSKSQVQAFSTSVRIIFETHALFLPFSRNCSGFHKREQITCIIFNKLFTLI